MRNVYEGKRKREKAKEIKGKTRTGTMMKTQSLKLSKDR